MNFAPARIRVKDRFIHIKNISTEPIKPYRGFSLTNLTTKMEKTLLRAKRQVDVKKAPGYTSVKVYFLGRNRAYIITVRLNMAKKFIR
jgi:hypothetical protein